MCGFCPRKTVEEIGYIVEIFGEEKIESSGPLCVDFGILQPVLPAFTGCDIVLEIIAVGEPDLEKRQ